MLKAHLAIEEANVDTLLSVYLISILGESLSDFKTLDLSSFFDNLMSDLVGSFSPQPFTSPISQHQLAVWIVFIIPLLKTANELSQRSVTPLVLIKIYLQTVAEGLPPHQEDKLLQSACTLTISDAVN